MIFQWVFVRSESAPPAGLRASLPGLFITSLPGGSAAAPGLLPATRGGGGGGPAGGVPEQRRAGRPAGSASRLVSSRPAAPDPAARLCPRPLFAPLVTGAPFSPWLSPLRRGRGWGLWEHLLPGEGEAAGKRVFFSEGWLVKKQSGAELEEKAS